MTGVSTLYWTKICYDAMEINIFFMTEASSIANSCCESRNMKSEGKIYRNLHLLYVICKKCQTLTVEDAEGEASILITRLISE